MHQPGEESGTARRGREGVGADWSWASALGVLPARPLEPAFGLSLASHADQPKPPGRAKSGATARQSKTSLSARRRFPRRDAQTTHPSLA
jgi:hypothetical protein